MVCSATDSQSAPPPCSSIPSLLTPSASCKGIGTSFDESRYDAPIEGIRLMERGVFHWWAPWALLIILNSSSSLVVLLIFSDAFRWPWYYTWFSSYKFYCSVTQDVTSDIEGSANHGWIAVQDREHAQSWWHPDTISNAIYALVGSNQFGSISDPWCSARLSRLDISVNGSSEFCWPRTKSRLKWVLLLWTARDLSLRLGPSSCKIGAWTGPGG